MDGGAAPCGGEAGTDDHRRGSEEEKGQHSAPRDGPPTRHAILGLDVGTTSVKAVVAECSHCAGAVGTKAGATAHTDSQVHRGARVIAVATRDTGAEVADCQAGAREQDVGTIVAALSEVAREAVAQAAAAQPDLPVTRVGVTGQMHGVVRWQAPSGGVGPPRACSSLATWEDRRCAPAFVQRCNRLAGATAQAWPLASGYGCTTLAWYAHHEPAELDRFDRVGTVMDYVTALVTGADANTMDPVNAASFGLFQVDRGEWDSASWSCLGIPHRLMPRVGASGSLIGTVSEAGARLLGVAPGTGVGLATGDHVCGLLASLTQAGATGTDAVVSIGTSAQLAVVLRGPQSCCRQLLKAVRAAHPGAAGFDVRPYLLPGRTIALAAPSTGGNSIACLVRAATQWAAFTAEAAGVDGDGVTRLLTDGTARDRLHSRLEAAALAEADAEGGAGPESSDGLAMVPTFWGERAAAGPSSPYNGASLRGVTAANFQLPRVYAACCAGVARVLADFMPAQVLQRAGVRRLVGGGGALARSEVLRRAVERQFGLPVLVDSQQRADAALGVAMLMSCAPLATAPGDVGGVPPTQDTPLPQAAEGAGFGCGSGDGEGSCKHKPVMMTQLQRCSACGRQFGCQQRPGLAEHGAQGEGRGQCNHRASSRHLVVKAIVVGLAVVGALYLARRAVRAVAGIDLRRVRSRP